MPESASDDILAEPSDVMLTRDGPVPFTYFSRSLCGECGNIADVVPYNICWPQNRRFALPSHRYTNNPGRKREIACWLETALVTDYVRLSQDNPQLAVHGFVTTRNQILREGGCLSKVSQTSTAIASLILHG